jgi:hypothetical protein
MTRRAFDEEGEALAPIVVDVAHAFSAPPFQPSAETGVVLDPTAETRLACVNGTTVP